MEVLVFVSVLWVVRSLFCAFYYPFEHTLSKKQILSVVNNIFFHAIELLTICLLWFGKLFE